MMSFRNVTSGSILNINWEVANKSNGDNPTNITYLEHVVLQVSLNLKDDMSSKNIYSYDDYYNALFNNPDEIDDVLYHSRSRRGDINIILVSPSGTKSNLLPYRNKDFIFDGYNKWPFMSLQFWGENPSGTWTCLISYKGTVGSVIVTDVELTLYGVANSHLNIPHICPTDCHLSNRCSSNMMCDVCKQYRDSKTLKCLPSCPNNTMTIVNYCINSDENDNFISPSKSFLLTSTPIFDEFSDYVITSSVEKTVASSIMNTQHGLYTSVVKPIIPTSIDDNLKPHGLSSASTMNIFGILTITIFPIMVYNIVL